MIIISGGQSGADISGNIFADKHNFLNDVNIFKGFKPVKGETYPKSTKFNYVCDKNHYIANLLCRTEYNVTHSDFTLVFVEEPIYLTKGSKKTIELCIKYKKDCAFVHIYTQVGTYWLFSQNIIENTFDTIDELKTILNKVNINILNIAGQRKINEKYIISILEKLLL